MINNKFYTELFLEFKQIKIITSGQSDVVNLIYAYTTCRFGE